MAPNALDSSNLEQLALKGLINARKLCQQAVADTGFEMCFSGERTR